MWNLLIPAAASIAGSFISGQANREAADRASAADREAARIQADAIREGRVAAERELGRVREENAPGQNYLRTVVAGSGELTPAQRMQLDELRRVTGNQLRTSAIAGSGRTAASLLRRTESEFTNDALERNRGRAYDAASGMAGRVASASSGIANLNATMIPKAGEVTGEATRRGGLYGAQADLATGKLYGSAIGELGSMISRASKYSNTGAPKPQTSYNENLDW